MDKELIILAIYINVDGMSRSHSQQEMHQLISMYKDMYDDVNKDVKVYWFPSNITKVDCIYPPPNVVGDSNVVENELIKIYKLFLSSKDGEAKDLISHIEKKLKLNKLFKKIKK